MIVQTKLLSKSTVCRKRNQIFFLNSNSRYVRFSEYKTLSSSTAANIVQDEEHRSKIWYGAAEIKVFKDNIKMDFILFKNRQLQKKGAFDSPTTKIMCVRGLEQIFDTTRQIKRRIAIRAVLKVQKRLNHSALPVKEYYIADISKNFSTIAKGRALLDGLADARNVNGYNCS